MNCERILQLLLQLQLFQFSNRILLVRYEGIIDDLLKELSTRLGFTYEIKEVVLIG